MTSETNNQTITSADAIQMVIGPPFDWCLVPAGQFIYGDDDKTGYREQSLPADRQNLHLPAFEMAKYPITYQQFQVFVDDEAGFKNPRWRHGFSQEQSDYVGEQKHPLAACPRENISWYDALAFCRWLSHKLWSAEKVEMTYYDPLNIETWLVRLPTEFEWEKAARGTDGWTYPWGNNFAQDKANTAESDFKQTTPVTQYMNGASPYGIVDMSGNVCEWCLSDHLNPQINPALEDISTDVLRTVRGSSWYLDGNCARATYRIFDPPEVRDEFGGFRIMRTRIQAKG